MAGKTSKTCWQDVEHFAAGKWGTRRTPLSGENSGHGGGDIIMRDKDALVECKLKGKSSHVTTFRTAQADAKKHGINPDHVFLYTRLKNDRKSYALVTMEADFFHERVLPLLMPLFTKEAKNEEHVAAVDTAANDPDTGVYTSLSKQVEGIPHDLQEKRVRRRRKATEEVEVPHVSNLGVRATRPRRKRDSKLLQP